VLTRDSRIPHQVATGNRELASDACDSEYLDATAEALPRIGS
jgi:hypothetical protein